MSIKILHVIPTLSSGGAEKQLVEVVAGTSREEFSHHVCVLSQSAFFASRIIESGHRLTDLGLTGRRPWLKASRAINALIKQSRPDIIHSRLYDASIATRLVKLRHRNIPLLTSLEAPDYEPEVIKAGNWPPAKVEALRWLDKISIAITDPYFIACSQFVAGSYQSKLGIHPSRISVLYNSVDLRSLNCAPEDPGKIRDSLGIARDDFVYLNIGRLDPQKGQLHLVKAFKEVLKSVPRAHLVIVGGGNLERKLKDLAVSLGIAERVHLTGVRKDIGACLEMSDAFVFPSIFEGLGIVLLEAMAKKLPCIASKLEVLEEVIDHGVSGLLVDPHSEAELTESMIRIHNDWRLRDSLGAEAFKKVEEKFSGAVVMPQWESLYRKIAASA